MNKSSRGFPPGIAGMGSNGMLGFPSAPPTNGVELAWQYHGDMNGVFYYAGSVGGLQPWTNPYTAKFVGISAASINQGTYDMITSRSSDTGFISQTSAGNAYIQIDLLGRSLILKGYSYRNRNNASATNPVSMRVLVSNDATNWRTVGVYAQDNTQDLWNYVPISSEDTAYRFLRFNTVLNQGSDTTYIVCAELELYGTLLLP